MSASPAASLVPEVPDAPPEPVSLLEAFVYWIKLGFVSFGGPAGLVGLIGGRIAPDRSEAQLLAGIAGASVATVFTFLLSSLFILIGAPAVEATRHDLKFTAPLTGTTAAVVGVVINPAVFFAWHVLWPKATQAAPLSGPFEWFSLVITIAALLALWRCEVGVIPVIGASTLAGLAFSVLI